MRPSYCWLTVLAGFLAPAIVHSAVPNSFILNEANSISGGKFIDKGRSDTVLGRLEGNGQNWMEFLVVQGNDLGGGSFGNTLDLRGWTIEWSYDKMDPADPNQFGSGVMEFTDDPLWAAVPRGTMLTMNEWQQVWYDTNTPPAYDPWGAGGLARAGGINGLGNVKNNPYNPATHTLRDFATDTSWDPAVGDWNIHVYAGERNPDTSFKYFNFSGSVTDGNDTYAIGTDDAGLYAVNNDNWQYTIKDALGNVIQGPIGEEDTGLGSTWRVSSEEVIKLEAFNGPGATQAQYLGATIHDYRDGSSSTFGGPNIWSSGAGNQGLDGLRSWWTASPAQPGDFDGDGDVDGADFVVWQTNFPKATGGTLDTGDADGDGDVDGADFVIWQTNFPFTPNPAVAQVPEPNSIFLLGAALLAVAMVARRTIAVRGKVTAS